MAAGTPQEPRKGLDEVPSYQEQISQLSVPPGEDFHCPEIPESVVPWGQESNTKLSDSSKYKTESKLVTTLYASDI